MKEKLIAGFMAALMTLMTAVYPVLGATALKDFPTFLGTDGTANFYVVMGAIADPSDVAGAVDIAVRLAELSYTTVAGAGAAVTGLDRDGVTLCTSPTLTNCVLSQSNGVGNGFPSTTLKNAQFSGLKTGTVSWNNVDYKYHEQVDVSGVHMRHDLATDKINGTEKMVVGTGADIKYQYVFDQAINLTTYNGKGSISVPEYDRPVKIKMLGKDFTIVGAGTSSVKMLSGSSGVVTATQGIEYGDYVFYGAAGVSGTGSGASLQVKVTDKAGNPIETVLVLLPNSADTTKTTPVLTIKVLSVSALTDGTVLGASIVVGPSGAAEVEYDATADTSSSTKDLFPGTTNWYITFTATGNGASGYLAPTASVNVEYRPSDVQYLVAPGKVSLPNDYGELSYDGFNTNTFTTVTVKPVGPITAYNSTDYSAASPLYGLEITADQPSSIGSGNLNSPNWWSSMYLLFNATVTDGTTTGWPVMVGYKSASGKIYVNDTIGRTTFTVGGKSGVTELAYAYLNATAGETFNYAFKLSYGGVGEATFYLNFTGVRGNSATPITATYAGSTGPVTSISMGFLNKTVWTNDFSGSPMQFRLGASTGSTEDYELNVTTEGVSSLGAGKKSQEIVDDSGLLVQNPSSNSGSDYVVFKVPNKALGVHVHFGKPSTATTGAGVYHVISPITSAVAVIDTEVTATHKAKNFVTVGGPCVNRETANALNVTFPTCGATGAALLGIASGEALIKVVDNYPATGLHTVVVAGYEKQNTRTASTVLQQYDTLLVGQTASAVKVTSATASGITAL